MSSEQRAETHQQIPELTATVQKIHVLACEMKIEHHRQIREGFRLSMRSSIQDRGNRSNHHSATPPLPAAVSAFSSQDDHEDRNGTENFQTLAESLAQQLSPRKRAAVNKESGACDPWSDEKTALSCVCRRAWIDDWGRCREEPLTCASPAPRARKRKQCHRCRLVLNRELHQCLSPHAHRVNRSTSSTLHLAFQLEPAHDSEPQRSHFPLTLAAALESKAITFVVRFTMGYE
ncbi:hypothetical protein B0J14DRAFT_556211 [Halenospora varia]|nr:hypothetical protein B0J14DRAFT_556211 [Halenospora varia]